MGGATINTASAMGRFFLTNMAGFAELERSLIAERTATALRYKKNNRQAYSPTPSGFNRAKNTKDKRLIENRKELALVRRILAQHEEGVSMNKIAQLLNGEGVKGKQGGKFYPSTISKILGNASLYTE